MPSNSVSPSSGSVTPPISNHSAPAAFAHRIISHTSRYPNGIRTSPLLFEPAKLYSPWSPLLQTQQKLPCSPDQRHHFGTSRTPGEIRMLPGKFQDTLPVNWRNVSAGPPQSLPLQFLQASRIRRIGDRHRSQRHLHGFSYSFSCRLAQRRKNFVLARPQIDRERVSIRVWRPHLVKPKFLQRFRKCLLPTAREDIQLDAKDPGNALCKDGHRLEDHSANRGIQVSPKLSHPENHVAGQSSGCHLLHRNCAPRMSIGVANHQENRLRT